MPVRVSSPFRWHLPLASRRSIPLPVAVSSVVLPSLTSTHGSSLSPALSTQLTRRSGDSRSRRRLRAPRGPLPTPSPSSMHLLSPPSTVLSPTLPGESPLRRQKTRLWTAHRVRTLSQRKAALLTPASPPPTPSLLHPLSSLPRRGSPRLPVSSTYLLSQSFFPLSFLFCRPVGYSVKSSIGTVISLSAPDPLSLLFFLRN